MKISDIPERKRTELNAGACETANLTEWLAIDQRTLLRKVGSDTKLNALHTLAKALPSISLPKQIAWIGHELSELKDLATLQNHPSDMVRCWACYATAARARSLTDAFAVVKPFAADPHFGVREIAWMAVRERICNEPVLSIATLISWTDDRDENIRRFSSEATRPRGVWAKHIASFKNDPTPALPLISRLSADKSRYVQNSVANWLNDAAKDNPEWVKNVVRAWSKSSPCQETRYIIGRATRSL